MSEPVKVPLSPTEAAYAAMVLEEYQALIRNADATRERRMHVLLDEKRIPQGLPVRAEMIDGVMSLVYTPATEGPVA